MRRILSVFLTLASAVTSAMAADYGSTPPGLGFKHPFYNATLPACDDPQVVATIPEKFFYADTRILKTGLTIRGIDSITEHGLKAGGPSLIDRRYCAATAWMSNGRTYEVVYLIEGPKVGFASIAWNVESCLPAFDPYRVYDAWCRSIRP